VLYLGFAFHRWLVTTWFLVRLWRFLTGEAHHGRPVTDRGWFRPGLRALTPTGHATRWRHLPRWQATAHRSGGTLAVLAAVWGSMVNPQVTGYGLAALAFSGLVLSAWLSVRKVRGRKDRLTWEHPLHLAIHELAGIPRAQLASSWISIETAPDSSVRSARLELPQGWPADAKDREKLIAITSTKLGIEAPDTSGSKWSGPSPVLMLTQSDPPPSLVRYEDVAEAVERSHANEFVVGVGKKGSIARASLSLDSPHFGINMGTGGGKSNLAAFWLVQELRRGAIAMILDSKWFSHPWLIKDTGGEYSQLPNIAYLSSPAELHAGMVWLGQELDRRAQVSRRAVTASGSMRADVGPRIIIVAEELNLAAPLIKQYWSDIRDRDDSKRSPALRGLAGVAFAGRALKMHMWLIGQMLTAEVTGTNDSSVKQNVGVWAMARYGVAGWRTAVGDVPMPPSPDVAGRIQLVMARSVAEVQTPLMDLALCRELVLAGQVTPCPAGMPGAVTVSRVPQLAGGPDLSPEVVSGPFPAAAGGAVLGLREAAVSHALHPRTTHNALKMARFRDEEFPEAVGLQGTEKQYRLADLVAWDQARRS
jgi:hypothetical protein